MSVEDRKNLLAHSFKKREKYYEIIEFLTDGDYENIQLTIKKTHLGIDGLFKTKKKMEISPDIFEDILWKLVATKDFVIESLIKEKG